MKYTAKKIIIEMTQLMEEINKNDIESAALALKMKQTKDLVLSGAATMDRSSIPTLTDMLDLYNRYDIKSEDLNKKVERLCQLIITNDWIVKTSDDIPESLVEDTILKAEDILLKISERRMNFLEMRNWIVQQQLKKACIMM